MRISKIAAATLAFAAFTVACDEAPTAPDTQVAGVTSTQEVHDNNNRVELTGNGVTGTAILNFIKGQRGKGSVWRNTANFKGLSSGSYEFGVLSGADFVVVCSFTLPGRAGCTSKAAVPGFTTAQLRDSGGNVVAEGDREERGPSRNI